MKKIVFLFVAISFATFSFSESCLTDGQITSAEICRMVTRSAELNCIKNTDLIYPNEWLLWEYPSGYIFLVKNNEGDCLSMIAYDLLEIGDPGDIFVKSDVIVIPTIPKDWKVYQELPESVYFPRTVEDNITMEEDNNLSDGQIIILIIFLILICYYSFYTCLNFYD